jgi:SagB-type dehydrogenase family enzyme
VRRLHPALLVHTAWLEGRRRLIAQASATRPPLALNHPLALTALASLPGEFDRATAGEAWGAAAIPETAHDQLWAAFEDAGLFDDEPPSGASWWNDLGWTEAQTYHLATRDYPFVQMDRGGAVARDVERMEEYSDTAPAPSPYQRLGGDGAVELPRFGDSADRLLAEMPAAERLGLPGVGLLLDVCFGERARIGVPGGATCLLKSIPSGGARHPTEIFVATFDLVGAPDGVYHYDVAGHRLELIRAGELHLEFAEATLDLFAKHDAAPAALLVFTSLVERAMWRYRDPRSFRAILVDVGHAVMAYRHVARLLGFRTYALQKLRDRRIAELLDVDPVAQPPLYAGTLVR